MKSAWTPRRTFFADTFTIDRGAVRALSPGDVVAFPRGRRGAHALCNRSDRPARYLMLSTKATPEVVEYPELGTVRIATHSPLDPPHEGEDPGRRLSLLFERADAKAERRGA